MGVGESNAVLQSGKGDTNMVDTMTIDGLRNVARRVSDISEHFAARTEPMPAVHNCPWLPESGAFLRALDAARDRHSGLLAEYSRYFSAAAGTMHSLDQATRGAETHAAHRFDGWMV